MPEEFGTVNVRRGDRAREIEVIRDRYKHHRDTLVKLAADAPTEHLATEYGRLAREIDSALAKLVELDATQSVKTAPGMKPLAPSPSAVGDIVPDEPTPASPARLALIIGAGLLVLAVIAGLMWRASSDERPITPIVTESSPPATAAPVTPVRAAPVVLSVEPPAHDYGALRKGTRAARQFEVANSTNQAIVITIPRSACRCLYYDYANVVPPKGKETITVTIDGARAKAGSLQETVTVTAKNNPSVTASFDVNATIR